MQYSNDMVQAMLQLLTNCTPEVASLRKELLVAVRHILATDLKTSKSDRLASYIHLFHKPSLLFYKPSSEHGRIKAEQAHGCRFLVAGEQLYIYHKIPIS